MFSLEKMQGRHGRVADFKYLKDCQIDDEGNLFCLAKGMVGLDSNN